MLTKWVMPSTDNSLTKKISASIGCARFVCDVLISRGYDTPEKIKALAATEGIYTLQDPFSFHGMREAVERIQGAIWMGENICVYGDYDCDGVTATTLLVSCLRGLGVDVIFYIPNRFSEGYGMNNDAIKKLCDDGARLIVTVDNGISATAEVDYALSLGIDVVVTDHHSIPAGPLPCVPIINPHLSECPSEFKDIAGVGVAFYLACALAEKSPEEMLNKYGDIVALGSVTDVVPLVADNRIFVIKGLEMLRTEQKRPGIKALMEVAAAQEKSLSSRTFGFSLGPRVNAAGRLVDATAAVNMMLTEDYEIALAEAKRLDELNTERKKVEEDIMKEIEDVFAKFPHILQRRVIVVSGEGWHQGVIGIVAARLVERYGKPSIVFAVSAGIAHGSGRSIPEISLIEAISACGDLLVRFGGHIQAAGMTVEAAKLESFSAAIDRVCVEKYPVMPVPCVHVDAEIDPEELSILNVKALSVLEPFGEQNPSPQFAITGATVVNFDSLSQGKHTKVHFKKMQKTFSALYFQMAPGDFPYRDGDIVDILVQLEVDEYRGEEQLSIFLRDIKPHGFDAGVVLSDSEAYNRHLRGMYGDGCAKKQLLPTREDIAAAFRFVRERSITPTPAELAYVTLGNLSYQKMLVTFDVMAEMGFVQAHGGNYLLADASTKRSLEESEILKSLSN